MIVATAGHIDHGKTSLVHALTGVHTDRLPEEKRRGISIELGYAYLDGAQGARIGFVDVPGHERLVHTMLAGVIGVNHALLVVAADDGVMPQTREHLAVLSLLGVAHGAVAVTKADRVDAARRASACAEVRAALQGTPLAASPVVCTSTHTGEGIDELKSLLAGEAAHTARSVRPEDAFRLAVDRVFTLSGVGTVATGTVHGGRVAVGDELCVVPGGRAVRVRSIHANDRAAEHALAGQRCALGLAGIAKDELDRGAWLVSPHAAASTQRIDVKLRLWQHETQPLRSGTHVHVHLGAASTLGSVALLEGSALQPGGTSLAQLVLQRPVGAWHGDRLVLRDASAARTLAGGVVVDPCAPVRYRQTALRLQLLQALEQRELGVVLSAAAQGIELQQLARSWAVRELNPPSTGTVRAQAAGHDWALGDAAVQAITESSLQVLDSFHRDHPDELGPDVHRLRRLAQPRLPEPLWQALLDQWRAQGRVALRGTRVHLPAHAAQLSATEQRIGQKALPLILQAGFEGAWVRDLAAATGEPESLVRAGLSSLARQGELHQVVRDLFYADTVMRRLAGIARGLAAEQGDHAITASGFRDAAQVGRKRAIQVLEYLDRIGVLRRAGEVHKLRLDCELFT